MTSAEIAQTLHAPSCRRDAVFELTTDRWARAGYHGAPFQLISSNGLLLPTEAGWRIDHDKSR